MVVSQWKFDLSQRDEVERRSEAVRKSLRQTPGVTMAEAFIDENDMGVAVIGYADRETYERVVNDPAGPFARALENTRLEEVGTWQSSQRGETLR